MQLGTIKQTAKLLKELGYSEWVCQALSDTPMADGQLETLLDNYRIGEDKLHIQWNFELDKGNIYHAPVTIAMVRVPLEHAVIAGIDSRELESRMKAVDWSIDYQDVPDFALETFKDKIAEVKGIYDDLNELSQSNEPAGEALADRLAVKYWSWEPPNDYSTYLEENKQDYLVSKSYAALPSLAGAYGELAALQQLKLSYMNRTNLENLKAEMRTLKVDEPLIKQAEENMEKGLPAFELKGQLPADKGQMDITIHFKQSGQSDYYYLNKYDLALSEKAKPLENDQKYVVTSPGENDRKLIRKFDSPVEAIAYFKTQTGDSELSRAVIANKKITDQVGLATMKDGKVDYVQKEFQTAYYNAPVTHTFYVEKGVGYNIQQGSNMLQKRAAYRDDLVSRAGVKYPAWNVIAFDKPKDKHGNYQIQQYNENYGFDVKKSLEEYRIKQLDDPKKTEEIIAELKNGNRPLVTVVDKDGKNVPMIIEAVPRYTNINFYLPDGKPEKREELLKESKLDQSLSKGTGKKKDLAESQEMSL